MRTILEGVVMLGVAGAAAALALICSLGLIVWLGGRAGEHRPDRHPR